MAYIEFTGPPACGKTKAAREMLGKDPTLAVGRRSLASGIACHRVNRLGLPPEGLSAWASIARSLPSGLLLALRFWRDTGQFRQARILLALLLKSRALAASPHLWVVDQGLQQHVLSAAAYRLLSPDRAMYWRKLCLEGPWRPNRLIELMASPDELARRVKNSSKHTHQCAGEPAEAYVERYVRAALSQKTATVAHEIWLQESSQNLSST